MAPKVELVDRFSCKQNSRHTGDMGVMALRHIRSIFSQRMCLSAITGLRTSATKSSLNQRQTQPHDRRSTGMVTYRRQSP